MTLHLNHDHGGNVLFYYIAFQWLLAHGYSLIIDGVCNSACTMALMFPSDRVCVTPEASMTFHAASGGADSVGTALLWSTYPEALRAKLGALGPRMVTMTWTHLRGLIAPCGLTL